VPRKPRLHMPGGHYTMRYRGGGIIGKYWDKSLLKKYEKLYWRIKIELEMYC
jgi:hypothetical protein